MLIVTIVNMIFVYTFFKELKIISFDKALAATLGFSPFIVHYLLMFFVSLTSVAAFSAVGSILVVSLMIGPAACAVLWSKDLKVTLLLAPLFGIINSVVGYVLALVFDTNISGMVATITLITFIIVLFANPRNGIVFSFYKEKLLKYEYSFITLAYHIDENSYDSLQSVNDVQKRLHWSAKKMDHVLKKSMAKGYLVKDVHHVGLTSKGKKHFNEKMFELS
jgi:manganese/zinc/iron transport system permease protein